MARPPVRRIRRAAPSNPLTQSSRWRRAALRLSAGLALLALAGCAAMPVKEGPTAKLLRGVEKPRDRNEMDITIHEVPVTGWSKCLQIVGKSHPMMAVLSVVTLSPIHGCALLPRDDELEPGERPWCIVGVPKGDADTLEHELRHCEGWDHPRSSENITERVTRD